MAHFLLLHGACHGGWCWDPVAARLRAAGHEVTAPDLPCDDLALGLQGTAEAAVAALPGDADDVVVVAHSLGGLSAPLVTPRVAARRMVMVAGVVGAPRSSLESLAAEDSERDLPMAESDLERDDAGRFRFTADGADRLLYHDCSPEIAGAATARLRFQRSMWREVADFDRWPQVETVSVVCADDRVIAPAWSRRVARERLGVEPVEIPGGHSPMLSRPETLTQVLLQGI